MITREEYLANPSLHNAYYSQFVTAGTVHQISRTIGVTALARSTDSHFNDIPLEKWDRAVGWAGRFVSGCTSLLYNTAIFKQATGSASYSCSDMVCIAKAAGMKLRLEHRETV